MTRQEEIREGIARWLFTFVREREDMKLDWEQTKGYYLQEADLLSQYLHSQGVVIKVRRELPKNPVKITHYLGLSKEEATTRQLEQDCFVQVIQDQMLNAGYVAVEPLIIEEIKE